MTGMDREPSEREAAEFNRVYGEGTALIQGELLLDGAAPPRAPGWFARRRLARAVRCFEAALCIVPTSWQSLWALGKIHQRLGDPRQSLLCFARAHAIEPSQPDVAREAALAACDCGDGPAAVRFARVAVELSPADAGLLSNLALALLINGEVEPARAAAGEAVSRAGEDAVAKTVRDLVEEVAAGRRARPTSTLEIR